MPQSSTPGSGGNSKRASEELPDDTNGKRLKIEPDSLDDPNIGGLFDPLPLDGTGGTPGAVGDSAGLDLPDFLSDKPGSVGPGQSSAYPSNSKASTPTPDFQGSYQQSPAGMNRVNSMGKLPTDNINTSHLGTSQLQHSRSQSSIQSSYPYQKTQSAYGNQYRAQGADNSQGYKPSIRFDPKKPYPQPTSFSTSAVPMAGSTMGGAPLNNGAGDKDKAEDPSKLNDALAAAGVDIQREEELLSTNYNRTALNLHQQQLVNRQRQSYGQLNAFLHPYHLALVMNRTARENGMMQNFMVDPEMLEFMSCACKEWLSNIVTKTVALAKHRRRSIPAFNGKVKQTGKQKTIPPAQRSELSKELRNIALKQKEMEERRVAKRALLGLEKSDEVAPEGGSKSGAAEETLHRAANATAAMMAMNPSRKKYSWMTSGAAGGAEEKSTGSKESGPKQSTLISSRGDNGLRFREIRTGNMITTKDLLGVLEEERMGTSKAVIKGYARLKD